MLLGMRVLFPGLWFLLGPRLGLWPCFRPRLWSWPCLRLRPCLRLWPCFRLRPRLPEPAVPLELASPVGLGVLAAQDALVGQPGAPAGRTFLLRRAFLLRWPYRLNWPLLGCRS